MPDTQGNMPSRRDADRLLEELVSNQRQLVKQQAETREELGKIVQVLRGNPKNHRDEGLVGAFHTYMGETNARLKAQETWQKWILGVLSGAIVGILVLAAKAIFSA